MNIKVVKQIDLTKLNGCKHPDIDSHKFYFVNYEGNWIYGKFSLMPYGWCFSWFGMNYAGLQINAFEEVWEVEISPEKELTSIPTFYKLVDSNDNVVGEYVLKK